jgi:hypothetical protein
MTHVDGLLLSVLFQAAKRGEYHLLWLCRHAAIRASIPLDWALIGWEWQCCCELSLQVPGLGIYGVLVHD